MRGIRGATQIASNTVQAMEEAVVELVRELEARNRMRPDQITWAIFTVTHDLDADFPARAARVAGWHQVPMICSREIPVPGSMPRVVRVLLHVDSDGVPHHVYLRGARALRPDIHHNVPFIDPAEAAAAARAAAPREAPAPAATPRRKATGRARPARKAAPRRAPARKGRGSRR